MLLKSISGVSISDKTNWLDLEYRVKRLKYHEFMSLCSEKVESFRHHNTVADHCYAQKPLFPCSHGTWMPSWRPDLSDSLISISLSHWIRKWNVQFPNHLQLKHKTLLWISAVFFPCIGNRNVAATKYRLRQLPRAGDSKLQWGPNPARCLIL